MQRYSKALILGLGDSGYAAARLLLSEGAEVTVVDQYDNTLLRERSENLVALGAQVGLGQSELPLEGVSACIVSPGVLADSDWVNTVRARDIPVIPELELGWSRLKCRVLAVTGSNGKSTLAKLCAESLARAGLKTGVAGNYEAQSSCGESFIEFGQGKLETSPVSLMVLRKQVLDWLVLEVSSFQLEIINEFRPDVGVLLNIHPNHLDRHKNMSDYQRIKRRLFSRMTQNDIGVIPESMMQEMNGVLEGIQPSWVSFGVSEDSSFKYQQCGVFCAGKRCISLDGTMFDNNVLGLTAAAAAAAVSACGQMCDCVEEAARCFAPLPHRIEECGRLNEIRFVDDSKSTNLASMNAALKVTHGPVRLIAGGQPKGDDYKSVAKVLSEKVVAVYLIGEAADAMYEAWSGSARCVISRTLERAVQDAFTEARSGETILLSPGCASFDQFRNFRERGQQFRLETERLRKKCLDI